jgi:hypothetical protein
MTGSLVLKSEITGCYIVYTMFFEVRNMIRARRLSVTSVMVCYPVHWFMYRLQDCLST